MSDGAGTLIRDGEMLVAVGTVARGSQVAATGGVSGSGARIHASSKNKTVQLHFVLTPDYRKHARGRASVPFGVRLPVVADPQVHSSRSRIKGSTDSARCAGIHVASSPSNDIAKTTPTNTSGSRGVAEYTMKASTRLARIPRSNPATEPKVSNLNARPNALCNTSLRRAPKAMRIPSSRSRLLTEYAAIPKMPVIASIAPITPNTPNAIVAMRAPKRIASSSLYLVWM